jgi:Ser/Thr protein kinase RdoA (MazF antagonist)
VGALFADLTLLGQARRLRVLAAEALRAYDVDPTSLRLLSNEWNCTFRVDTAGGPLVLRVMRRDTLSARTKVGSEVEFVTALAAATDVSPPRVISNRAAEQFTTASADGVPEPRACVLFEWVPGSTLDHHVTPQRWADLGELTAKMHRFASSFQPSAAFDAVTYRSVLAFGELEQLFDPGALDLLGLDGLLREAYEVTNQRIATVMRDQPHVVIHGDLHAQNVKVSHGMLTPFDFEDLLWAVPILDVATVLYYVRHRPDYLELARAFRDGYQRLLPWVETRPGEVDQLLVARGIDMLNFVAIDPSLDMGDWEAYVRLREVPALVAVGVHPPVVL